MKLRNRAGVIAVFLVALVGGGVATAAWLVSGTATATTQPATAARSPIGSLPADATPQVPASLSLRHHVPVKLRTHASGSATVTMPAAPLRRRPSDVIRTASSDTARAT